MKYIQKVIPEVTTPEEWKGNKISTIRALALATTKKLYENDTIINEDIGIHIHILTGGIRKTAYGGAIYYKKAVSLLILPEILRYARYNNFGERKEKDPSSVIGYLNFACKCKIDGKIENLRVAVQFKNDGKFYYNIEINKIEKK